MIWWAVVRVFLAQFGRANWNTCRAQPHKSSISTNRFAYKTLNCSISFQFIFVVNSIVAVVVVAVFLLSVFFPHLSLPVSVSLLPVWMHHKRLLNNRNQFGPYSNIRVWILKKRDSDCKRIGSFIRLRCDFAILFNWYKWKSRDNRFWYHTN